MYKISFKGGHHRQNRREISLFTCIFCGKGKLKYMGYDSTDHRGQRLEQQPWLASVTSLVEGDGHWSMFCIVMEA